MIDPLLTLGCLCWFAFIVTWIAVAALERRRVAAKARRLRENRAAIDRAWVEAVEMMEHEKGRE